MDWLKTIFIVACFLILLVLVGQIVAAIGPSSTEGSAAKGVLRQRVDATGTPEWVDTPDNAGSAPTFANMAGIVLAGALGTGRWATFEGLAVSLLVACALAVLGWRLLWKAKA